jgi:FlaA1/EpsC-like NDP-sugar epimerase
MQFPKRNTPRWIIFLLDLATAVVAIVVAYLVRFEFNPPAIEIELARQFFLWFLLIRSTGFVLGRTYAGIIRYTSTQDTVRIFTVLTAGSAFILALNAARYIWGDGLFFLPTSIIILEYLLSLFAMIVGRMAIKVLYMELKTPDVVRKRVAIFGAGEGGILTKRTIDRDSRSRMSVIAFFDDDDSKSGKKIEGTDIYSTQRLEEFMDAGKVDELILAAPSIATARRDQLVDLALKKGVRIASVPPADQWVRGQLSLRQIRDVRIEDLLGRDAISIDDANVRKALDGKRILVSGAAGSIGSEIVRQLLSLNPEHLILLDQAETPLFELNTELRLLFPYARIEVALGDIRQEDRMRRMFEHFKPHIVFHAAAYKHVPMIEDNPSEAVLTNVWGTRVMAELSHTFHVEKFIFISTDKAVNPTNVMGATKRAAELFIQWRNTSSTTAFITTRFGNVLGSNGSVIPIFKKQIESGGPITVTHPEVTRFFMTIPEAACLVLEAAGMGTGGEIYAFDMGQSVRIVDLAEKMVRLSGLEPGVDIEIRFSGLRPGEKLYEEVLANNEATLPTHHPKIVVARSAPHNWEQVKQQVDELIALFDSQDNEALVRKLKQLVPEYVSRNSTFERLDA